MERSLPLESCLKSRKRMVCDFRPARASRAGPKPASRLRLLGEITFDLMRLYGMKDLLKVRDFVRLEIIATETLRQHINQYWYTIFRRNSPIYHASLLSLRNKRRKFILPRKLRERLSGKRNSQTRRRNPYLLLGLVIDTYAPFYGFTPLKGHTNRDTAQSRCSSDPCSISHQEPLVPLIQYLSRLSSMAFTCSSRSKQGKRRAWCLHHLLPRHSMHQRRRIQSARVNRSSASTVTQFLPFA